MNKSIKKDNSFKPSDFELKWQKIWEEKGIYQPDLLRARRPFYNLMMFPYPSAEGLHVGNMYAFTGVDIFGRFMRMQGFDVFEPIGLDGFGIHSENYAIKIGKNPKEQAKISEKNFYRQLHAIGNGFAWKNTLETYDPGYYRWTQWLFIQMFKHGLAYKKKSPVNFCPSCKTVLSDEQVVKKNKLDQSDQLDQSYDGCERCGSQVEKRNLEQWFFRISKYAEKLLQNTFKPSFKWSEKVKIGQRNWIGKKTGINITYPVVGSDKDTSEVPTQSGRGGPAKGGDSSDLPAGEAGVEESGINKPIGSVTCFTTRPDTNFGATFVVVAPEHPFVASLLSPHSPHHPHIPHSLQEEIRTYIEGSKKKTPQERIAEGREKTGVFTGFYCVNQLNNYKMPLYISDFVLMEFGTGAVVGVPGHDRRDFEFAQKFNLPVVRVVVGSDSDKSPIKKIEQVQEEEGTMVNSQFLNGMDINKATEKIMDYLEKNGWGKRVTTYKLRDWCISRQRYWGAPIPMIYCESCAKKGLGWFSIHQGKNQESCLALPCRQAGGRQAGIKNQGKNDKNIHDSHFMIHDSNHMPGWFPVPEDQLPVLLPDLADWKPEGTGKGPLAKLESFVNVACPECGFAARRESDVCDTFLDSSWYFLRYPSVNKSQISEFKSQINPKSQNSNTDDHNQKGLEIRNLKLEIPWNREITRRWLPVNMYIGGAEHTVLHLLYSRFVTMALHDMGYLDFSAQGGEPYRQFYAHGLIIAEGTKMSKSRGNIVIPDEYIAKYGADALRTYLMFLGPFDQGGDFRDTGIAGMHKFLGRVWRLVSEYIESRIKNQELRIKDQGKSNINIHASCFMLHDSKLLHSMHHTIKEVTRDLENLRYNTAIAHIMEYVNYLQDNLKFAICNLEFAKVLLLLLAPFAPHMTEELFQKIKSVQLDQLDQSSRFSSIHQTAWPQYDPQLLVEDTVTIVIQVNGKIRDTIKISNLKSQISNEVEKIARPSEKVQKYLSGHAIRKVIFVPGRLINFVI